MLVNCYPASSINDTHRIAMEISTLLKVEMTTEDTECKATHGFLKEACLTGIIFSKSA